MNKDLTVHTSAVTELYYYAIQQGAPVEQLMAMSGLQAEHFVNPDARIPVQQLVLLWHAAVELTGNPALALQLGARSNPNNAGIISLVCMNAPTLGLRHIFNTVRRIISQSMKKFFLLRCSLSNKTIFWYSVKIF